MGHARGPRVCATRALAAPHAPPSSPFAPRIAPATARAMRRGRRAIVIPATRETSVRSPCPSAVRWAAPHMARVPPARTQPCPMEERADARAAMASLRRRAPTPQARARRVSPPLWLRYWVCCQVAAAHGAPSAALVAVAALASRACALLGLAAPAASERRRAVRRTATRTERASMASAPASAAGRESSVPLRRTNAPEAVADTVRALEWA